MGDVGGIIRRRITATVYGCLDEVLHALLDSLVDKGLALAFFAFEAFAFCERALVQIC
jgi:hypothetical protein